MHGARDRTGAREEEDPCEDDPDGMAGNRSDDAALTDEEENEVDDGKEEGPPADEDRVADSASNGGSGFSAPWARPS